MEKMLNNLDIYQGFASETWENNRDKKSLSQYLQDVVNNWARSLGISQDICTVKLVRLRGAEEGRFNHKTKELQLSYDLVVNKLKPPYYQHGVPCKNSLSNKETMYILAHEFRHAVQNYYRQNPNACQNLDYVKNLSNNTEHAQNKELRAYFKNYGGASELLYMMQFTERDAYAFSNDFCKQWTSAMHEKYPNDLAFTMHDDFAKFDKQIAKAEIVFKTKTLFQDIDEVLAYINDKTAKIPSNKKMWDLVQETQQKNILEKAQTYIEIKQKQLRDLWERFPFDMHESNKTLSQNDPQSQETTLHKEDQGRDWR